MAIPQQHAFHLLPVGQGNQQLFRSVRRLLVAADLQRHQGKGLGQLLPQRLRQIRHGVEIQSPLLQHPLADLPRAKCRLSPFCEPRFQTIQVIQQGLHDRRILLNMVR